MGKSRILVVGATGEMGKFIVEASVKLGHPTFILARPSASSASDPAKKELLAEFERLGAVSLHGDLGDHASLVAALKQVDIVISTVGGAALLDGQLKLIDAIKEVGHIKRFVPSEFAANIDLYPPNEKSSLDLVFAPKRVIRKALREEGIPYTLICSGGFARWVWAPLAQLDIFLSGDIQPPREKITIMGSGEGQVVASAEVDTATLTVMAADDPRALNKQLVIRPKQNLLSFNSIVKLWEKKLGHNLQKTFVPEAEVQKRIDGSSPSMANFGEAITWELVSGREVFPLGPSDVDSEELYPDYKYVTVDEYLDNFIEKKQT